MCTHLLLPRADAGRVQVVVRVQVAAARAVVLERERGAVRQQRRRARVVQAVAYQPRLEARRVEAVAVTAGYMWDTHHHTLRFNCLSSVVASTRKAIRKTFGVPGFKYRVVQVYLFNISVKKISVTVRRRNAVRPAPHLSLVMSNCNRDRE